MHRRMALHAVMTEIPGYMIRVRCPVEIRDVALITVIINQLIVAVCMASLTLRSNMSACEREVCRRMVKRSRIPVDGGMALHAVMTEIPGYMVGIRCSVEIRDVALIAIIVDQLIIAVRMARLTLDCDMGASQRKIRRRVVEGCGTPIDSVMALNAIVTEVTGHMVWICCSAKIYCVALVTIVIHQLEIAIGMAILTLRFNMGAGQREVRRRMVKRRRIPVHGGVTLDAVMTEVPCYMVWISCPGKIRGMALIAIVVHQLIVAVGVA